MSPSAYRVGCATTDITPPAGMPCLSWMPRHLPIRSVHDPLFARAACLEAGDERAVIVSADTIGFADTLLGPGRSFVGETKHAIAQAAGLPPSHIMLASNHIHSSAETLGFRPLAETYPNAQAWLKSLQAALAQCAAMACDGMVEAELNIARGAAPGLSFNRRGDECLDDEVIVLLFEAADGPELILVNYACHPVVMQAQEVVSADYVGAMTTAVEARLPRLRSCQFLLGACGDIDPRSGATRRFSDAQHMGLSLADEVLRLAAAAGGAGRSTEPAVVKAVSTAVPFPSRPLPPAPEVQRLNAWAEAERRALLEMPESPAKAARIDRLASTEEELVRMEEGAGPFAGEVQVIRIGGAVLMGLPGEVFCASGRHIKALCEPLVGIPVSCANGYLGYLAPPEAWEKGGYETELGLWSKVGPEAVALAIGVIEKLLPGVTAPRRTP